MRRPFAAVVTAALLATACGAAAAAQAKTPFLWGVATAGFQGDMGPGAPNDTNSDWWVWLRDPDNIANHRVSGDLPENGPAQWTHYRQDVKLARAVGANAFRLSIEWSRIFPHSTAGATSMAQLDALADQSALAHYRAELTAIRGAGMTPFVTLEHFTLPLWIDDPIATRAAFANVGADDPPPANLTAAGWLSPATITEFGKYAGYVASKLGDLVDYWSPINEPNVVAVQGYLNVPGVFASWFPPGVFNYQAVLDALTGEEKANAAAYDAVKKVDPTSRVGLVQHMIAWHPAKPKSATDRRGAAHADYLFNRLFLDAATKEHKADFIGVNYYRRGTVTGLGQPLSKHIPLYDFIPKLAYSRKECPTTCSDLGWEIYPAGLGEVIREVRRYKLPIYVTENGIADSRDRLRAAYIRDHVHAMRLAMKKGADVRGYFYWSLEDNLEWTDGYKPKFGLFTKTRKMRASAKTFAALRPRDRPGS